ncbi:hypothetical protein [Oligoflexus tunisiensis]|uniref:hypothetical protein n=1 Tax=Oligoflexus tunisiensis TaxID=708132 RepID=UPI00114CD089|nr:hypothetical protein [Oligoflexus tunisiensis]
MLTFDHRDFTKSALSLAGGMLGVALLAAWRSEGDIPTMSLTLGLPVGVVAFWGIYSLRMKRLAQELGFVRDHPRITPKGGPVRGSFKPKLLHRGSHTRLTTDAGRQLPRFRTRPRASPLTWDTQDTPPVRDQWYM